MSDLKLSEGFAAAATGTVLTMTSIFALGGSATTCLVVLIQP